MNVREYLSVRRAFGLARQEMPAEKRITFEELAIVCHLGNLGRPLRTSEIAEYQGVLRPTMTHRTGHLSELGLISRDPGEQDRRSVCCSLTDLGRACIAEFTQAVCGHIKNGMPLSRCVPERLQLIIDEMGTMSVSAAELVLIGLASFEDRCCENVSELVAGLGLLQPTVSMAVSSLEKCGLVTRMRECQPAGHALPVALTADGVARADELVGRIDAMRVRRPRTA